ncbi:glycosyltransferase family 1 protein [Paraburkholderia metrosideri]|uniref:Glycosyltransferase family 1 protein n=1 Tax=Paraburkholderia metrosideri TaxID=580937 RepID=A0ABW9E3A2_9BURK
MSRSIVVNTKILKSPITGVQRYLNEILENSDVSFTKVSPGFVKGGVVGHLWEQLVLPLLVRGNILWSPSNSGPLILKNQVVTIHDMVPLDHPESLTPLFVIWYKFLLPRLIKRARKIIAISEFTRSRVLAHTSADPTKIVVIPNGVDEKFTPQDPATVEMVRSKLGLPTRYLLSVGSLEPRKNLARVLQAWEKVHTELPDNICLVLAGGKGKKRVFQEVSVDASVPGVHFIGHVSDSDLPALYCGAEAFVYMSFYEGFGLPPLEAMACGVPTLTGNLTALPEVVGDDGALTVSPFDVEAIADGIKKIVCDDVLRNNLRVAGLRRAAEFSWVRTAQMSVDAIRSIEN